MRYWNQSQQALEFNFSGSDIFGVLGLRGAQLVLLYSSILGDGILTLLLVVTVFCLLVILVVLQKTISSGDISLFLVFWDSGKLSLSLLYWFMVMLAMADGLTVPVPMKCLLHQGNS